MIDQMIFYNVEIGDSLLVAYRGGGFNYAKTITVIRITPQQIITDDPDLRYWRKNGKQIASKGHIIKIL